MLLRQPEAYIGAQPQKDTLKDSLIFFGVSTEYPTTIALDFTVHLLLKNEKCARIN